MRIVFSFTVFFIIAKSICAQENRKTNPYYFNSWNYDWADKPENAMIFADACNLRSAPTSGASVLTKMYVGDKVKVLGVTQKDTTINGINDYWINVEYGKFKGYAWGGFITNEKLKLTDSTYAVWGISKAENYGTDSVDLEVSIRIFCKKQIIKQTSFKTEHSDNPLHAYIEVIEHPLLDGVDRIIVYNTLADACGVAWSEVYLFETSDSLIEFEEGYGISEAALFHHSDTYLFPTKEKQNDFSIDYFRNPDKNQIFKVVSHDEYDEQCIWNEHTKVESFEWKEGKLVPFCRQ